MVKHQIGVAIVRRRTVVGEGVAGPPLAELVYVVGVLIVLVHPGWGVVVAKREDYFEAFLAQLLHLGSFELDVAAILFTLARVVFAPAEFEHLGLNPCISLFLQVCVAVVLTYQPKVVVVGAREARCVQARQRTRVVDNREGHDDYT